MREGVVSRGDLVNSVRNWFMVEERVVIRRGVALPSCLWIKVIVSMGVSLLCWDRIVGSRNEVVG